MTLRRLGALAGADHAILEIVMATHAGMTTTKALGTQKWGVGPTVVALKQ